MKKKINKKGFTLIELLAVIIILAILMTLAITAMSGYIRNARKDTFITTAQQYANAARLSFVNGEYGASIADGNCIAVPITKIELESGSHSSSFDSDFSTDSYIIIHNTVTSGQDKYEYYIQMIDEAGNGFAVTKESELERDDVLEKSATADTITDGTALNAAGGLTCSSVTVIS